MGKGKPGNATLADAVLASLSAAEPTRTDFATPEWYEHFEALLASAGALTALSPERRTAFITLVQRQIAELFDVDRALTIRAARKEIVKHGPARLRSYARQSTKIHTATEALIERGQLDGIIRPNDADRFRAGVTAVLGDSSKLLAKGYTTIAGQKALLVAEDPPVDNFKSRMWLALSDFLVDQCRLKRNEAEIRIARLARAILAQRVTSTDRYERDAGDGKERPKGAEGLRKAISRSRSAAADKPTKNQ